MDHGQSLLIPPLFDGTNYAYWKFHMKAFLQALDQKVWLDVEVGWKKPSDPPATWDDGKIKVANFNSRALNALFSGVTNEAFRDRNKSPTRGYPVRPNPNGSDFTQPDK